MVLVPTFKCQGSLHGKTDYIPIMVPVHQISKLICAFNALKHFQQFLSFKLNCDARADCNQWLSISTLSLSLSFWLILSLSLTFSFFISLSLCLSISFFHSLSLFVSSFSLKLSVRSSFARFCLCLSCQTLVCVCMCWPIAIFVTATGTSAIHCRLL